MTRTRSSTYIIIIIILITIIFVSSAARTTSASNSTYSSVARVRDSPGYSKQIPPVLDLWNVVLSRRGVTVFAPDEESVRAIERAGGAIFGTSLRATSGVPSRIPIEVRDETMAMGVHCGRNGAVPIGDAYFLKPWFHNNFYHITSDAAMLLSHVATTPPPPLPAEKMMSLPSSSSSRSSSSSSSPPSLLPSLFLFGNKALSDALPWARRVFFDSAVFPGGTAAAAGLLSSTEGVCVRGLHWGSPFRPLSSFNAPIETRRDAVSVLRRHVRRVCQGSGSAGGSARIGNKENATAAPAAPAAASSPSPEMKRSPHVIFVSRPGQGGRSGSGVGRQRQFHLGSLERLASAFRRASSREEKAATAAASPSFEVCCDFLGRHRDPCAIFRAFARADIVVGMHGAGLTNAIFAAGPKRPARSLLPSSSPTSHEGGSVLVELRSTFGSDLDIFAQLAHASGMGYMLVNVNRDGRNKHHHAQKGTTANNASSSHNGASWLTDENIERVARCAVGMWRHRRGGGTGTSNDFEGETTKAVTEEKNKNREDDEEDEDEYKNNEKGASSHEGEAQAGDRTLEDMCALSRLQSNGLVGYSPVGYSDDECHRRRRRIRKARAKERRSHGRSGRSAVGACYPGLRTAATATATATTGAVGDLIS